METNQKLISTKIAGKGIIYQKIPTEDSDSKIGYMVVLWRSDRDIEGLNLDNFSSVADLLDHNFENILFVSGKDVPKPNLVGEVKVVEFKIYKKKIKGTDIEIEVARNLKVSGRTLNIVIDKKIEPDGLLHHSSRVHDPRPTARSKGNNSELYTWGHLTTCDHNQIGSYEFPEVSMFVNNSRAEFALGNEVSYSPLDVPILGINITIAKDIVKGAHDC